MERFRRRTGTDEDRWKIRSGLAAGCVAAALCTPSAASAQFTLQDSTTTASLRGISSPGNGVAWASGTNGTVLRTEDSGFVWQGCATPPGADKLDFRGVQALDAQIALVMSSGKGDLSRVYKTTDGCRTWTLVFTNPDPDGFFDAIQTMPLARTAVLGDPVGGAFPIFRIPDSVAGDVHRETLPAMAGEAAFAASNEAMLLANAADACAVTGGAQVEFVCRQGQGGQVFRSAIPIASSPSSGAFAVRRNPASTALVVVGGDYTKPAANVRTAAWSADGSTWIPAETPPHGYRSSVAYEAAAKTWITVGPNGTDISRDDGRNWSPLRPVADDPPDADRDWNALDLPFVVGPHGRIGRLRDGVLRPAASGKPQPVQASPKSAAPKVVQQP